MEPTAALRSIETVLRLVIRDILGDTRWMQAKGAPDVEKLRERQVEEGKRRDGTIVSVNLIDYTETYHLLSIIRKNWEQFQPVFSDKARTEAFFGVIEDVRNSVAHSRDLVPFERDLISGIAGQFRNQVSLFRSNVDPSAKYYPLIESVRDNFGTEGVQPLGGAMTTKTRIDVGAVLTFTGSAFNSKGGQIRWRIVCTKGMNFTDVTPAIDVAEGDTATFNYTVTETDVSEYFYVSVRITTDSRYHRNMPTSVYSPEVPFDDSLLFLYAVNPPHED